MRFVNYTGATVICSSKSDNLKQDEIKFSQSMCLRCPFIFFSIGFNFAKLFPCYYIADS